VDYHPGNVKRRLGRYIRQFGKLVFMMRLLPHIFEQIENDMKMKAILLGTILTCQCLFALAQETLEITIKNIQTKEGTVRVALFNSETDFLKKPVQTISIPADQEEVKAVFENLPVATYAVSVYHDFNDNEKLDSNFVGMPTEAYGFSNDARGTFGPPSFSKASFHLKAGKNQGLITIQ
jgi:uncharacterized protein (DUF2141 family)